MLSSNERKLLYSLSRGESAIMSYSLLSKMIQAGLVSYNDKWILTEKGRIMLGFKNNDGDDNGETEVFPCGE